MKVVERLGRSRQRLVWAGCACDTTTDKVERLLDGVPAIPQGKR
jgi:hypothetical protein